MNNTSHYLAEKSATPMMSPADIAICCDDFEQKLIRADSREQLLLAAGEVLQQNSATFCSRIVFHTDESEEPLMETVSSEFEETPAHLQKWAVTTAIKAMATDKPVVESAVDQMGFQVHMVGIILSRSESKSELLAALFSGGSEDAVKEVLLVNTVRQAVSNWNAREERLELQRLAQDTAALIDLRSRIENAETVEECSGQIANEVSLYIQDMLEETAEHVTVFAGTVEQGQPRLVAVSGTDALPQETTISEAIESAFGECICRNQVTIWPARSDSDRHATLCHSRLAEVLNRNHIQSVLLHDSKGKVVGVITLATSSPVNERVRSIICSSAQSLGATLELIKRAELNHVQKMINRARDSFQSNKTKTTIKCLVAVLLIGLVPMPYRVATDCELQPLERRYVCAPFKAQLGRSHVEPGDIVTKDQLLATLDEREIRMELAEVEANFHRASKKRDGLVAAHESGEARLADLEADGLRARNELLTHRAENLRLKSPIDGMVIEGDHKDNEGMPLEVGQSLYQVAPLGELNVELFVPDADVRYVKEGMPATVRLNAFPFESWSGTIKRIQPSAEIRKDDSVFVATVQIQNTDGRLRPGMTGSARISSVWRPIVWNWLHQPVARCLRWVGW